MKNLFRTIIFLAISLLFIACDQTSQLAPRSSATPFPSDTPVPSQTQTPTTTPTASPAATATIKVTPRPTYALPTLIPTIDPTLLPDLLSKALSIETMELNSYKARRITGWDLGWAGWYCGGYYWLDTDHLLIYPVAGEDQWGEGGSRYSIAPQPIVVNVGTGAFWAPPLNQSESPSKCGRVDWSTKLKILVTWETRGDVSTVSTYTYEGKKLTSYPGELSSISPSGTKILMKDGIVLDLQTNEKIKLNWNLENYEAPPPPSAVYWTSDETRIYQCCYLYADLAHRISYRYTESDFLDSRGNPLNYEGLWMYRGEWLRDNKYFLVWWSYVDDGDIRYLPMFNPAKKIIYDVRAMAGISPDLTCYETDVSLDGQYLWIMCYEENYLVNLSNFETTIYPGYTQVDIYWSDDSQFAWLSNYNYNTSENNIEILSVASKEIKPLPIGPLSESYLWWHPTDHILVYPTKDKNALIFLDASTMAVRELPFKDQDSRYKISDLAWSPNGDKLIFITESHILWQVDYPALENLEQIIASTNTISGAQWSPDGKSISFLNGADIYIVDASK